MKTLIFLSFIFSSFTVSAGWECQRTPDQLNYYGEAKELYDYFNSSIVNSNKKKCSSAKIKIIHVCRDEEGKDLRYTKLEVILEKGKGYYHHANILLSPNSETSENYSFDGQTLKFENVWNQDIGKVSTVIKIKKDDEGKITSLKSKAWHSYFFYAKQRITCL